MLGQEITFSNGAEHVRGYLSKSVTGAGPGLLVLQEYWGLVPHIMDVCDRFAAAGFTALAPDLYHGETTTDPDDAATMMQALHIGETEAILRKAGLILLADPATKPNDKIGIVGFCMGGQLALYAAGCNPAIRATVDFYGIHPNVQPSFRDVNGPILGFFAERDKGTGPETVASLDRELTLLEKPHRFVTFPGTDHAFFNDTRPAVYNKEAAEEAWTQMIQFFNEELA